MSTLFNYSPHHLAYLILVSSDVTAVRRSRQQFQKCQVPAPKTTTSTLQHIVLTYITGNITHTRRCAPPPSDVGLETCFGWSRPRSRASKSRSRTSRSRVSAVNLLKTSRDHGKSNYSRITRMCILDSSY